MVLEKTLESFLGSKEIKPVNSKGNQLWIFIGKTDTEAPTLWPSDAKSQLLGKDPDAGKDWGQEENGVIEDEMISWHHWVNEHEFEQTLGEGEGQRSLVCCSPWNSRVGHDLVTEQQHTSPQFLCFSYIEGHNKVSVHQGDKETISKMKKRLAHMDLSPMLWLKGSAISGRLINFISLELLICKMEVMGLNI